MFLLITYNSYINFKYTLIMTKETIPIKIINIKLIKCNNRQLKFNTNVFYLTYA